MTTITGRNQNLVFWEARTMTSSIRRPPRKQNWLCSPRTISFPLRLGFGHKDDLEATFPQVFDEGGGSDDLAARRQFEK